LERFYFLAGRKVLQSNQNSFMERKLFSHDVKDFCQQHHIRRLALFGGGRFGADFGPESDIEVFIEFEEGHAPVLDFYSLMEVELSKLIGRKVDLQSRNFVSYDITYKNGMAKELYTMPSDKLIFKVVVWVGDNPGLRLTMEASNADEVTEYLHEKYGPDIVFSIWNEEAANKPR
jgi:predicted nucleotidyltransferase